MEGRHAETVSQTSEEQSFVTRSTAPVQIPRINQQSADGVQSVNSFHSVSSLDSSAEMAKYFPDAHTPRLSPTNQQQQQQAEQTYQTQSVATTNHSTAVSNSGPYATAQPQLLQVAQAPVAVARQEVTQASVAPQLPAGIPGYSSEIDGVSMPQTIVNDVIVDLQTKVINETQNQYYNEFATAIPFESLSPIYIRAPNPSIILRSDLHRLREQLKAQPAVRHAGSANHFQVPSFPPPQ